MAAKLTTTATTTTTTKVALSLKALTMIKTRIAEDKKIAAEIKDREARRGRLKKEIDDIFTTEGQREALEAGVEIDGIPIQEVGGDTRSVNELEIMKIYDLSPEEFEAAFVTRKPKKKYLRIGAPKKEKEY